MSLPSKNLSKALNAYFAKRGDVPGLQAELADEVKISQATLHRLRHHKIPTVSYDTWMILHRYAPDEFPHPCTADDNVAAATAQSRPDNIDHINIIGRFKNADLAMEINRSLLQLEKISTDGLSEIKAYIDILINKALAPKKTDIACNNN